jgi:DNA mismatch repair protein MutS
VRDGGVIATGYDAELDELRLLATNTDEFLVELEARERERSGIPSPEARLQPRAGFLTSRSARARPSACRRTTCAARR